MRELVLDLSKYDKGVNLALWQQVQNVWAVVPKAGGSDDGRYKDSCFEDFYARAKKLGLHVGAYYYSVAKTVDAARKDAEHFLSLVAGKTFDMPLFLDFEDKAQLQIGKRLLTDVVKAFCDRVADAGYMAGTYTFGSAWVTNVYTEELTKYANWVAAWRTGWPTYAKDAGLWQQGCMNIHGDLLFEDPCRADYQDVSWCQIDYPAMINGEEEGKTMSKLTYAQMAAEVCDHFIDHAAHGYSQPNRDGDGTVESLTLSDGTTVEFNGGDRDCSRLMQTCYVVVGVLPRGIHMWTGNEIEVLKSAGFKQVALGDVQRGDVLWRSGHTEMYLGDGKQGGARRSENHSIDGRTGDQDGQEITRSTYYPGEWTSAWRCTKVRQQQQEPAKKGARKVDQVPGEAKNAYGFYYRVHVKNLDWLEYVHDGQVAGTTGRSLRMEAMQITPPLGVTLNATAHIQGIGDKTYKGIKRTDKPTTKTNPIIGTTGKSKRLEAFRLDVVQITGNLSGKVLKYRGHVEGTGWTKVCKQGEWCGTRGKSKRLEAVEIWIE